MKEIKLTQGKVALVDDEDFEYLNQWKWCAAKYGNLFYAVRGVGLPNRRTKHIKMTNIIMGEPPLDMWRDHLDGNGLNNQRGNLRFVTKRQNGQNRHYTKNPHLPGVYWNKKNSKWVAEICINGKGMYLGSFPYEEEAFKAYRKAVENLGERVVERCQNY